MKHNVVSVRCSKQYEGYCKTFFYNDDFSTKLLQKLIKRITFANNTIATTMAIKQVDLMHLFHLNPALGSYFVRLDLLHLLPSYQ